MRIIPIQQRQNGKMNTIEKKKNKGTARLIKHTKTFALPKSHNFTWWVCGFTCTKYETMNLHLTITQRKASVAHKLWLTKY